MKTTICILFATSCCLLATSISGTLAATSTIPGLAPTTTNTAACVTPPGSCSTTLPGLSQSSGNDFNVLASLDAALGSSVAAAVSGTPVNPVASTITERVWQDTESPSSLDLAVDSRLTANPSQPATAVVSSRVDRLAYQTNPAGNFITSFGLVYAAFLSIGQGAATNGLIDFNASSGTLKVSSGNRVSGSIDMLYSRFTPAGSFTDRLFSLAFTNGIITDAFSATPLSLPTIGSIAVFEVGIPNQIFSGPLSFVEGLPITQQFTTQQFATAATVVPEPSTTIAGLCALALALALRPARQSTAPPAAPTAPAPANSTQTHHPFSNTASS